MIDYKNKIKVIGFDLDQTLYPKSSEIDEAIQGYIYQKLSQFRGCDLSQAKKLFDALYQEGRGLGGGRTLIELGMANGREIVQEALEKADITKFLKPNPAISKFLRDLRKKYADLDLITGSGNVITLDKLVKLDIPNDLFSHIIAGASKSIGNAYKEWLSYYANLEPDKFLYIGDRVSDFTVPKELGIHSILVNVKQDDSIDCLQFPALLDIRGILLK